MIKNQLLPQSLEAEKSVLGSILIDDKSLIEIADILKPADFYKQTHQIIYKAILELHNQNKPIDIVILSELLKKQNKLEEIGGYTYLARLTEDIPTSVNIKFYAEIVKEKSILRNLIISFEDSIRDICSGKDCLDILTEVDRRISDLFQTQIKDSAIEPKELARKINEDLSYRVDNRINYTGISSGFRDLDKFIGGFDKGDLVVVGGQTGMGKTAFMLDIVHRLCIKQNLGCLILSLEMSDLQIGYRLVSKISGVKLWNITQGTLRTKEFKEVNEGIAKIFNSRIIVDYCPNLNIFKLESKVKRRKVKDNIDILIIDYIQLVQNVIRNRARYEEVSGVARRLKTLAGELGICIICGAQLDASVPEDGRPRFNSVRESKAVEHEADSLIFINRLNYNDFENKNKTTEIIIRKARHGIPGIAKFIFDDLTVSFVEKDN